MGRAISALAKFDRKVAGRLLEFRDLPTGARSNPFSDPRLCRLITYAGRTANDHDIDLSAELMKSTTGGG